MAPEVHFALGEGSIEGLKPTHRNLETSGSLSTLFPNKEVFGVSSCLALYQGQPGERMYRTDLVYATNKRKKVGDLLSDCNQFHIKFSLYQRFPFS